MQLRVLDVAAERFTDDYLNSYVFGPMQAMVDLRTKTLNDFKTVAEWLEKQRKYVGNVSEQEFKENEAEAKEAIAEEANALDAIEKKKTEIDKEKVDNEVERAQLIKSVELIHNMLRLSILASPRGGKVNVRVVAGVFVEKGDLLFEIGT
jgi:hypothetical protein